MKKILLCGSLLVASAILVSACSGDDDDDGGSAVLTNGAYTYTGGLTTNTCNFDPAASFYGDGGSADVTVTATTVTVDLGGPYEYTLSGTSLQDEANSTSQTILCTGTTSTGAYNCGSRSYNCSITADLDFGGQVTGADAFTLEDSYSYSGTGADCAIVATSAFGAGTTFPCTTVDAGDFAK